MSQQSLLLVVSSDNSTSCSNHAIAGDHMAGSCDPRKHSIVSLSAIILMVLEGAFWTSAWRNVEVKKGSS